MPALNAVIEEVRPISTAILEALQAGQKDVALAKAQEAVTLFKTKPVPKNVVEKYTKRMMKLGLDTDDTEMMLTSKLIEGAHELAPAYVKKDPLIYLTSKLERKERLLKTRIREHKELEAARDIHEDNRSKWAQDVKNDDHHNAPGKY